MAEQSAVAAAAATAAAAVTNEEAEGVGLRRGGPQAERRQTDHHGEEHFFHGKRSSLKAERTAATAILTAGIRPNVLATLPALKTTGNESASVSRGIEKHGRVKKDKLIAGRASR